MAGLVVVLVGCASPAPDPGPTPAPGSVRAALVDAGAALAVSPRSGGEVTARVWRGGWQAGQVDLAVAGGDLLLSADRDGRLRVDELALALAPVPLPDEVFGQPARLTDLAVELAADAAPAPTRWFGGDAATADVTLDLRLRWSLDTDGRVTPLGPVTLTDLPVALAIDGTPAAIHATVGLRADGTLWSWAHLVELADLTLALDAEGAAAP